MSEQLPVIDFIAFNPHTACVENQFGVPLTPAQIMAEQAAARALNYRPVEHYDRAGRLMLNGQLATPEQVGALKAEEQSRIDELPPYRHVDFAALDKISGPDGMIDNVGDENTGRVIGLMLAEVTGRHQV